MVDKVQKDQYLRCFRKLQLLSIFKVLILSTENQFSLVQDFIINIKLNSKFTVNKKISFWRCVENATVTSKDNLQNKTRLTLINFLRPRRF